MRHVAPNHVKYLGSQETQTWYRHYPSLMGGFVYIAQGNIYMDKLE